jgi:integrase
MVSLSFLWVRPFRRGVPLSVLWPRLTPELLAKKQLKKLRFHDLRHTHATMLLLEHVSIKVISERLGHSSTNITQDIYSHVLPEMQMEAASAMERILTPAKPEPTQPTPPTATSGKVISFAERAALKKQTSCA